MSWASDWTEGDGYAKVQAEAKAQADALAKAESKELAGALSVTASTGDLSFSRSIFDGEKFPGGLSAVNELFDLDYWGLRARSNELYHRNAYARGIIRRLVTNIITTGLFLESTPDEEVIGKEPDSLSDWSDEVETRYFIYGNTPEIIDSKRQRNIGDLQRTIKTEAFVGGDVLTVLRQHPRFKLPVVQIIPGDRVATPYNLISNKNIIDGVEIDDMGRHVAYYVTDADDEFKHTRILARGSKTGRRQSKLIYGCDKREDGVRGVPILGIAIQPLAEIDRYRDSTQRKATLNSMLSFFIERDVNFKGKKSRVTGKGAKRRETTVDVVDSSGEQRQIPFDDMLPGLTMNDLNPGEKPVAMPNNGVDINFGAFETTIMMGLAWALEIPPEILFLSFNKSFSASKSAVNEFNMYLEKERERFGSDFCDFLYQDWFMSMTLLGKIDSESYMVDYMDPIRWDSARAWTMAEWAGQMKPTTDLMATVKAHGEAIEMGLTTVARSARVIFGLKGARVWKQRRKEKAILADIAKIGQPDPVVETDNDTDKKDDAE